MDIFEAVEEAEKVLHLCKHFEEEEQYDKKRMELALFHLVCAVHKLLGDIGQALEDEYHHPQKEDV